MKRNLVFFILATTVGSLIAVPTGAQLPTTPRQQVVPLSANDLYRGWLASRVLGKGVISKTGLGLGTLRNIMIGDDGWIQALIIDDDSTGGAEFVFRVPWRNVHSSLLPDRVVVDVSSRRQSEFDIFPDDEKKAEMSQEFAVSAVINDYARLQTGRGYGYVRDVVFTPEGRMRAVLVTRSARLGGGTVAFGFPASPAERWDPGTSYYGLPYVTTEQADAAAVSADLKHFKTD
jgi:sporulation protein YlmC with PRC-barrel domain